MDCSKTVDFMKEKERMCKASDCNICPIGSHLNKYNCVCDYFVQKHIEKAVEIVQKWSDEHPLEIDWTKVPIDTPVLVSCDGIHYNERYFVVYVPNLPRPFYTFYLRNKRETAQDIHGWKYCKLDPSVDPTPYYKE